MADTMEIPVDEIETWLVEMEEQIKKSEKPVRDFLEGERHAYVRILRKWGTGKQYQDFKKKWCEENNI
jgi:hypothetical protein